MASGNDQRESPTQLLPFRLNKLSDELKKRAAEELNEDDEAQAKIEKLRTLIHANENFEVPTDDAFLVQFLRSKKFDVQRAFTTLKNCYHRMNGNRDVFDNCDPTAVRELLDTGHVYCLPHRAPDGAVVMVVRCEVWDTDIFDIRTVINAWMRCLWHCIDDPATQVTGIHSFADAKGLSFKHVRCLKPRHLYMFGQNIRNSMPLRFKGFHMFNESPVLHLLWSAVSFFLTDKLRKRVHFHGSSLESLQEHLPKSMLPTEYGGDITGSLPDEEYLDSIEKFHSRYVQIVQSPGEKLTTDKNID